MVRFTSLLGQPFTSEPTACPGNRTSSLVLMNCSSESVIEAPGTLTEGLRPIRIVASSLILLGLSPA